MQISHCIGKEGYPLSDEPIEKESPGIKFLKVLLVILIPLVFILTVTTLFLKVSGFNINQEMTTLASKVPVVSHFVGAKNTKTSVGTSATATGTPDTNATATGTPGTNAKQLQQTVTDQNKKITRLQNQVNQDQKTITDLKGQITNLNKSSKQAAKVAQNKKAQEKANVIAMTFQNMDPQKAAAIFEKMSLQSAANDMNLLSNQTKAKIMEALSPDTAAKLTPLLAANPYQSSSTSTTSATGTTP